MCSRYNNNNIGPIVLECLLIETIIIQNSFPNSLNKYFHNFLMKRTPSWVPFSKDNTYVAKYVYKKDYLFVNQNLLLLYCFEQDNG